MNLPAHIALIVDGNRRWAKGRNLPYIEGHKEALHRIREIVEYAADVGIQYFTLWLWSTKNWKRNAKFVKDIMVLFRQHLSIDEGVFRDAVDKGAKIHHIGKMDGFPQDIQQGFRGLLKAKPDKKRIDINVAIGYGGRDEVVRAVKQMVNDNVAAKDIDTKKISSYLDTAGQPDVDLVIRTGGERRTSGCLIWQAADAELYFTKTYMPDFGPTQFQEAIDDYQLRERRLGGDSQNY